MARGLNKAMLIGHLGTDPEMRVTPSGQSVVNFTLATNESFRDSNGNMQERTEWHRIVAWGKLAEICNQYLKKGRQVYVEGRLQTRSWDDSKTGEKKYTTEIICTDMQMLGSGRDQGQHDNSTSFRQSSAPKSTDRQDNPEQGGGASETEKDDLPF